MAALGAPLPTLLTDDSDAAGSCGSNEMTISTCSAACAALAGSCPPPAGAAPPHSGSEVRRGWADESSALGDCGLESGWSAAAASDELLRTVRAAPRPAACVGSNTGGRQSARGTPSSVPVPAGPPPNTPYTSQPASQHHNVARLHCMLLLAFDQRQTNELAATRYTKLHA